MSRLIRSRLRTLSRLVAVGSLTVAAIVSPITVIVDFDEPLMAPPLASTLLLGSSSTLFAIAGCLLRHHVAPLLGLAPAALSAGRVTYDLRRLRLHGLIERQPKRHRYRVTDAGLRLALFLPRVWARTVRPGLATVMPDVAPNDGALRRAFERLEQAMDESCAQAKVAA